MKVLWLRHRSAYSKPGMPNASIGGVGFLIWCHTFKMAVMTSAHLSVLHMQQHIPTAR